MGFLGPPFNVPRLQFRGGPLDGCTCIELTGDWCYTVPLRVGDMLALGAHSGRQLIGCDEQYVYRKLGTKNGRWYQFDYFLDLDADED